MKVTQLTAAMHLAACDRVLPPYPGNTESPDIGDLFEHDGLYVLTPDAAPDSSSRDPDLIDPFDVALPSLSADPSQAAVLREIPWHDDMTAKMIHGQTPVERCINNQLSPLPQDTSSRWNRFCAGVFSNHTDALFAGRIGPNQTVGLAEEIYIRSIRYFTKQKELLWTEEILTRYEPLFYAVVDLLIHLDSPGAMTLAANWLADALTFWSRLKPDPNQMAAPMQVGIPLTLLGALEIGNSPSENNPLKPELNSFTYFSAHNMARPMLLSSVKPIGGMIHSHEIFAYHLAKFGQDVMQEKDARALWQKLVTHIRNATGDEAVQAFCILQEYLSWLLFMVRHDRALAASANGYGKNLTWNSDFYDDILFLLEASSKNLAEALALPPPPGTTEPYKRIFQATLGFMMNNPAALRSTTSIKSHWQNISDTLISSLKKNLTGAELLSLTSVSQAWCHPALDSGWGIVDSDEARLLRHVEHVQKYFELLHRILPEDFSDRNQLASVKIHLRQIYTSMIMLLEKNFGRSPGSQNTAAHHRQAALTSEYLVLMKKIADLIGKDFYS